MYLATPRQRGTCKYQSLHTSPSSNEVKYELNWVYLYKEVTFDNLELIVLKLFFENISFPGPGSPLSQICQIVHLRVGIRLKRSSQRPRKSGCRIWMWRDIRCLAVIALRETHIYSSRTSSLINNLCIRTSFWSWTDWHQGVLVQLSRYKCFLFALSLNGSL